MRTRTFPFAIVLALAASSASAQSSPSGEEPAGLPLPEATTAKISSSVSPGWERADAPNGRLLPLNDLEAIKDQALVLSGDKAALYAVGKDATDYHPEREPIVFVHGLKGESATFGPLTKRLGDRYQVYVLCYDDFDRRTMLNAEDFADELRGLPASLGRKPDLTIVAHSMGGLLTRRALNELTVGPGGGIDSFASVRFLAVDTPWHGYIGPSDNGLLRFLFHGALSIPKGVEDLVAASQLFTGKPGADNPAERDGLYDVKLPGSVSTELMFAKQGSIVLDYNERSWYGGDLRPLDDKIVALYTEGKPVDGSRELVNFWKALEQSTNFVSFDAEIKTLAAAGTLDKSSAHEALAKSFPEFAGTHRNVFAEHPEGPSLLDHLQEILLPSSSTTPGIVGALSEER